MNLADLHRLRKTNHAAGQYLDAVDVERRKKKISKKIIYSFDDFADSDKMLLEGILKEFRKISPGCYIAISGSRIRGNWHEDDDEFGTSDWDIVIRNILQPDRELIRRTILPKLEAKFKIKIDSNLTGFGGRYVEVT